MEGHLPIPTIILLSVGIDAIEMEQEPPLLICEDVRLSDLITVRDGTLCLDVGAHLISESGESTASTAPTILIPGGVPTLACGLHLDGFWDDAIRDSRRVDIHANTVQRSDLSLRLLIR